MLTLVLLFTILLHVVRGSYFFEKTKNVNPDGLHPNKIPSEQPTSSNPHPKSVVQSSSPQSSNVPVASLTPVNTYNSIGISDTEIAYYQPDGSFDPAAQFNDFEENLLPNRYNRNASDSTSISTDANTSLIISADLPNVPDFSTSLNVVNSTMTPDLQDFKFAPLVRRALRKNLEAKFTSPNYNPNSSRDFVQDIFRSFQEIQQFDWAYIFSRTMSKWKLFGNNRYGPEWLAYFSFFRVIEASGFRQLSRYSAQFSSNDSQMEKLIRMLKDISKDKNLLLEPAKVYQTLLYFYGKYKSKASSDLLGTIKLLNVNEFISTFNAISDAVATLSQNGRNQFFQPQSPSQPESRGYSENVAPNTLYQHIQQQHYITNMSPTEYYPSQHSNSSMAQYPPVAGVFTADYISAVAHSQIPFESNWSSPTEIGNRNSAMIQPIQNQPELPTSGNGDTLAQNYSSLQPSLPDSIVAPNLQGNELKDQQERNKRPNKRRRIKNNY